MPGNKQLGSLLLTFSVQTTISELFARAKQFSGSTTPARHFRLWEWPKGGPSKISERVRVVR